MANPTLTIQTKRGNILCELFEDKTPVTAGKFIELIEKGYYTGLSFHRVVPNFVIQGGCPDGTGRGGPGYNFECEIIPGLLHEKGSLSMAHTGQCKHNPSTGEKIGGSCTNGSQFFITHRATSHLDGVHTVFGKVLEGQDVVDAIEQGDVMDSVALDKS
jgi:peptidyl-prolyl cis-trans isomerase B (cyclophilin B)